jgi:hypothetical protein
MKDAAKISDGDILDVLLSEEKEYDITIKSMIKYAIFQSIDGQYNSQPQKG